MTIWDVLCRKKHLSDPASNEKSPDTQRVIGFKDLLLLGIGNTLGVGVYVLAGSVVPIAGPSVVISFCIAAIAATLSGLCYAEFSVRLPKAGSAYTYTYVYIGEFIAFTVGWILILEYIVGPASISRGVSSYLDSILNMSANVTMKDAFSDVAYLGNTTYWSSYFDFLAFGLPILASGLVAFGLQESLMLKVVYISINILVVLFVIIAGSTVADKENWNDYLFFPNGKIAMIKAAATCFFGFIGFDCIATTGEEVRRPQRLIPLSIPVSLLIIFVINSGISAVLTLMGTEFSQNVSNPLVYAFEDSNMWPGASWIISIGALLGLTSRLFGAMFPLPRIIYAMAVDGLLFPFLGSVSSQIRTTVFTTLISGLIAGIVAAVFDLTHLIEMMSLGTLIAYTIVAASVLLLRHRPNEENFNHNSYVKTKSTSLTSHTIKQVMKQVINVHCHNKPTQLTFSIIVIEIISFSVLSLGMGVAVLTLNVNLEQPWAIAIVGIIGCFLILLLISMSSQPRAETNLPFQVPLVPLIPALSMFVNLFLMVMLSYETWIRFALWMTAGFSTYLLYGTNHSRVENDISQQSYNGGVLSISRISEEDYNMPTAPVHIAIQAPTPSPSWASLNSFNISKSLQSIESESSNSNKVHSENGIPTLSEYKYEHLSNEDNTRKESEETVKELNVDIDFFVDDAFSCISSRSSRQETNTGSSQDSILQIQTNTETNYNEFIEENNSTPSQNETEENNSTPSQIETEENKATNEEISLKIKSKNNELKNENDNDFHDKGIKKSELLAQTIDQKILDPEKIEDAKLFHEDRYSENNLDESVEYQHLNKQSLITQVMSYGEKTPENNEEKCVSSYTLANIINTDVSKASPSEGEINLVENAHKKEENSAEKMSSNNDVGIESKKLSDKEDNIVVRGEINHGENIQNKFLQKQSMMEQKESNGEKKSENNNIFTASKVLSSRDNVVGKESNAAEGIKPNKNVNYKITRETVKPLVIDFSNSVNIKIQDDSLKSKSIKENSGAKKVLNSSVPKDVYQKNNNIEIISKPKVINRNKNHINVIRSSTSSSLTESAQKNIPTREVTSEERNEQHHLINAYPVSNQHSTHSILDIKPVPTNTSTKIFQQKSNTFGRDSDKRKTIKIIQKSKPRAPLPPQLRSKTESSSEIPHEKNESSLSRTFSIRNSEFSNKLNELLKTKLETGPQPTQNSLKNVNSKSVNDLVNLKEMNEEILLSSDYHILPGNSSNHQKERQGTVFRSFNNKDRISGSDFQSKELVSTIVSTKEENMSHPFKNDNSEDTRKEIKKKLENLFTQKIKPVERPSIRPQQSTEATKEDFETIKRQRLLMGDVLASIKFVKTKSDNSVQNPLKKESIISSASKDEVFTRDNVSNSIVIQNKQSTAL